MANLGLIVGDSALLTTGDTVIRDTLLTEHSITIHSDIDAEVMGKDGIVLCESCSSADLGSKYAGFNTPLLALDVGYWDTLELANVTNNNAGGPLEGFLIAHEITNGVTIPTASAGGLFGPTLANIAPGGQLFYRNNANTHALGWAVEQGKPLWLGNANKRIVALSIIDSHAANLNSSGQLLLLNATNWILSPPSVNQFTSISAFSVARRIHAKRTRIA